MQKEKMCTQQKLSQDMKLLHACCQDDISLVKTLLEEGVDPNGLDAPRRPLFQCAVGNFVGTARLLMEHGADVNIRYHDGKTPLVLALLQTPINGEVAREILKHKADVNISDTDYRTPLHCLVSRFADMEDTLPYVKLLLENGACLNACDRYRSTPLSLHLANGWISDYSPDLTALLLKHGTLVQDPKLIETLAWLMQHGSRGEKLRKIVRYFIDAGLSVRDCSKLLRSSRDEEITSLLKMRCFHAHSLLSLCRTVIRNEISFVTEGESILPYISALPLPEILKRYLSLM